MGDWPQISLYCEDSGHEQFARALLSRLAEEVGLRAGIRTSSGRGGHGRVMTEFKTWQRAVVSGRGIQEIPDLLILLIDANCTGWPQVHREIMNWIDTRNFPRVTVGCPDPHIERWCLADPEAVHSVLGIASPADPGKCDRHIYKQLLRKTILTAGHPILTNEMEYAADFIAAMDLYRAGKNQPSLRHFVEEIRRALQSMREGATQV